MFGMVLSYKMLILARDRLPKLSYKANYKNEIRTYRADYYRIIENRYVTIEGVAVYGRSVAGIKK